MDKKTYTLSQDLVHRIIETLRDHWFIEVEDGISFNNNSIIKLSEDLEAEINGTNQTN